MKAKVVNYRGGKHTQKANELVLEVEGVASKEDSKKLLKKKVEWTTPSGKKISGEVSKVHGNKGCVLARFEKGLPGQALGTSAEVLA
jgi:large subunit ribosomal protein L35Ae